MYKIKSVKLDGKSVYMKRKNEKVTKNYYPSGGIFNGKQLYGFVDEIWFRKHSYLIVIDKPRSPNGEPFLSDKRQALGYCLAFIEDYSEVAFPTIAVIRDKNTRKSLWHKRFDPDDKYDINDCVDRILTIIDGSREPVASNRPQKCRVCEWKGVCDKSKA